MIFKKTAKAGWLLLSVFFFSILLCMAALEVFLLYPQTLQYFDKSQSIAARPFSARSRDYLHKSLELALNTPFNAAHSAQITENLDLAYSQLNFHFYLKAHPCTSPSLAKLDQLVQKFSTQNPPDITHFSRTWLPAAAFTTGQTSQPQPQ